MKPGYKTTEFWLSIAVILIASAMGILAIIYGKELGEKAMSGVSMLVIYLKAHGYNLGRIKEKIEEAINRRSQPDPSPTPSPDPTPSPTPSPNPTVVVDNNEEDKSSVAVTTKIMPKTTTVTTTIK